MPEYRIMQKEASKERRLPLRGNSWTQVRFSVAQVVPLYAEAG